MSRILCATLAVMLPWVVQAAAPFGADLVERGAYLARAADCTACHTAPGGKPFSGGLPMSTPMGKVYATNITPDPNTGIGRYSEADFARALREGVGKEHNLYPAMPYPSYTKLRDDDVHALYAFFMQGVAPVNQANSPSTIPWPLNMRWPLKLWNAVFLKKGVYQDKPGKDAQWNRGAYLVQAAGHCGACHTPRGIAFQEKSLDESGADYLRGALLDSWFASDLTGNQNVGLGQWKEAELAAFLQVGANAHATAFGSMSDVINNSTQNLSASDITAMTVYLKSLRADGNTDKSLYVYDPLSTQNVLMRPAGNQGAILYGTYCAGCHGTTGLAFAPYLAPLAGNPNVIQSDPSSLINVTLNGTHDLVIAGLPAAFPMPSYGSVLTDQEVAAIVSFIRSGWNNKAGAVDAETVKTLRKKTQNS